MDLEAYFLYKFLFFLPKMYYYHKKEILSLKKIHRNNLNKLFERKSVNKFQASSQLNHFTKSISPEKNLKKHYFLSR